MAIEIRFNFCDLDISTSSSHEDPKHAAKKVVPIVDATINESKPHHFEAHIWIAVETHIHIINLEVSADTPIRSPQNANCRGGH